jgi:hypothetical protein
MWSGATRTEAEVHDDYYSCRDSTHWYDFISCVPVCSGGSDYLVNGACVNLSGALDYDFKWEFSLDNEET